MIWWFFEEVGTNFLVFGDVFRHVLGVSSHLLQKLPQLTAKKQFFKPKAMFTGNFGVCVKR